MNETERVWLKLVEWRVIYTLIGCFRYMQTVRFDLCDYESLSFVIGQVKSDS